MKNILFVVSHLFSGSDELVKNLNENPRIDLKPGYFTYSNPLVLEHLVGLGHKLDNAAAIYGDHLLYNSYFSNKVFYQFSKFIYVIRHPKLVIGQIISQHEKYNELTAARYYELRLRRIYEMAYHTPNAVLLTWDHLKDGKGMHLIEEYLGLKNPVSIPEMIQDGEEISFDQQKQLDEYYEKYIYKFKQLNLRSVF